VVPAATSLAGKHAGKTERGVATADAFVAVGCSERSGDLAVALAVLSRSRIASEVTERAKLDGIARMEAAAKSLAWPPASRVGS